MPGTRIETPSKVTIQCIIQTEALKDENGVINHNTGKIGINREGRAGYVGTYTFRVEVNKKGSLSMEKAPLHKKDTISTPMKGPRASCLY